MKTEELFGHSNFGSCTKNSIVPQFLGAQSKFRGSNEENFANVLSQLVLKTVVPYKKKI